MANEKKAGIFNASERDGVQYRKASLLEMILGNANWMGDGIARRTYDVRLGIW